MLEVCVRVWLSSRDVSGRAGGRAGGLPAAAWLPVVIIRKEGSSNREKESSSLRVFLLIFSIYISIFCLYSRRQHHLLTLSLTEGTYRVEMKFWPRFLTHSRFFIHSPSLILIWAHASTLFTASDTRSINIISERHKYGPNSWNTNGKIVFLLENTKFPSSTVGDLVPLLSRSDQKTVNIILSSQTWYWQLANRS